MAERERPRDGQEALLRWMGAKIEDPATIDWSTRFRAAADEADRFGRHHLAGELREFAVHAPPYVVEAIGRALLGEEG